VKVHGGSRFARTVVRHISPPLSVCCSPQEFVIVVRRGMNEIDEILDITEGLAFDRNVGFSKLGTKALQVPG